jgi:hypothetical protein
MTIEHEKAMPETTAKKMSTSASGLMSGMLQNFEPVRNHDMHFSSLHFYASAPTRQVEANHYCGHLTEDFRQCLIYDSHNTYKARLIGVEYIISGRMYEQLPEEERQYWHSHRYEVHSGLLLMPGVPEMQEDVEMRKLGDTYGKTWHFWQVDRGDPLPYGPAQLMGAFTAPGQVNAQLLKLRDEKFGVDTLKKAQHRMGMQFPAPHPSADKFGQP